MALKQGATQLFGQAGLLPCLARTLQRGYAASTSEKFTVEASSNYRVVDGLVGLYHWSSLNAFTVLYSVPVLSGANTAADELIMLL